ncbi:MAG: hypothetical protein MHM6MM_003905 [Cercozoa sp. M6MM]
MACSFAEKSGRVVVLWHDVSSVRRTFGHANVAAFLEACKYDNNGGEAEAEKINRATLCLAMSGTLLPVRLQHEFEGGWWRVRTRDDHSLTVLPSAKPAESTTVMEEAVMDLASLSELRKECSDLSATACSMLRLPEAFDSVLRRLKDGTKEEVANGICARALNWRTTTWVPIVHLKTDAERPRTALPEEPEDHEQWPDDDPNYHYANRKTNERRDCCRPVLEYLSAKMLM